MISEHGSRWNAGADASYRMLRTRILHRVRSNRWTTSVVTSPSQGDGKSLTALNLALSIAREGNSNVFLLDLDMRNPTLCNNLGVVPPVDMNDYLAADGRPEDLLFSIGVDNLILAGSVTSTNRASELLATRGVEKLFSYIRSIAPQPLVLVDLPPILATDDALDRGSDGRRVLARGLRGTLAPRQRRGSNRLAVRVHARRHRAESLASGDQGLSLQLQLSTAAADTPVQCNRWHF